MLNAEISILVKKMVKKIYTCKKIPHSSQNEPHMNFKV